MTAPMFRFTIRDVLWLTAVVALALGLLVGHRNYRKLADENRDLRMDIDQQKRALDYFFKEYKSAAANTDRLTAILDCRVPDWRTSADEPSPLNRP